MAALFSLTGCSGMTEPIDIAVAEELCGKRGGFSSVARYHHGFSLIITCNDGTYLDVILQKKGTTR